MLFYSHSTVRPVISKLSSYPITDLSYTGDEDLVKRWRFILDDCLNIKSHFINASLDYNAMGNSLVSMFFPFERWLKCDSCNGKNTIENVHKWSYKELIFKGECPDCGVITKFEPEDKYIRDIKKLNLIRWSIENIDCKFVEITGRSRYYYTIPNRIKKAVLSNDLDVIKDLPLKFLQAIKEDKSIELDLDNLFHMRQITLAEEDQGMGRSLISSSMLDIFYLQILRKANETIAMQYIVPLTILYPEANASVDPYKHINLSEWRTRIEEEILKWKDDSAYLPVMPIPLGSEQIFGNAKALMITPEIRSVTEQIITGMGVPPEFVFGGMQWSGSHVSLRMIENQLLRHREQMTRMLNFIVDRISRFFHIKKIEIKFSDFKMADDIQLKQIVGNLVSGQNASLQGYIQDFGLDWPTEQKQIVQEMEFKNKLQRMQLLAQAEAQAEGMLITSRAQTKAQVEQKKVTDQVQQQDVIGQLQGALALQRDQVQEQQQAQTGAPQGGSTAQQPEQSAAQQPNPEHPMSDGLKADDKGGSKGDSGPTGFDHVPMDPRMMARQLAVQLNSVDPAERDKYMHGIKSTMPNMYTLLVSQQQLLDQHRKQHPVDKDPPKHKPPRRNKGGLL